MRNANERPVPVLAYIQKFKKKRNIQIYSTYVYIYCIEDKKKKRMGHAADRRKKSLNMQQVYIHTEMPITDLPYADAQPGPLRCLSPS